MGRILAKLHDDVEPAIRAAHTHLAERCKSCAFRAGTIPNGCIETVLDAFACAISGQTFWCHQRFGPGGEPVDLCAGWQVALGQVPVALERVLTPVINEMNLARAAKDFETQAIRNGRPE